MHQIKIQSLKLGNNKIKTNVFYSVSSTMNYPKKPRFQSVRIAALCLYNIQRENLVFKKSLSTYFVAGISLSMAEASVAAPFTSRNVDISCVPYLIRLTN